MTATHDCILIATARPDHRAYQQEARRVFEYNSPEALMPWSWIFTTCDEWCLNPAHMYARSPVKVGYVSGVCVYCGFPAGTRDHLLPKWASDLSRRQFVVTVPACTQCNSIIGEFGSPNVNARRDKAHDGIRRRYRRLLEVPDRTPAELAEFGPRLRQFIEGKAREKLGIESRLAWPETPFYDIAAFQRGGIPDPVALGMVDDVSATREEVTP